jgi:hypothetical protein
MSRAQLTSTVEQSSGGVVAPFLAGKNKIINGDCLIAQRGVTFTNIVAGTYTLDRWQTQTLTLNATVTQDTSVPNVAFNYSLKVSPYSNGTVSGNYIMRQWMEQPVAASLVGQNCTLSFWIKSSKTSIKARVASFNSTGGSDNTLTFTISANTWTKISGTFASFSSISAWTGLGSGYAGGFIDIGFLDNSTLTTSDYFQITGVQLEAGNVATPFTTASGTLQGELALCQRYLPVLQGGGDVYPGYAYGTNAVVYSLALPVTARVAPTGITLAGSGTYLGWGLNTSYSITPLFNAGTQNSITVYAGSGATIVAGQGSRFTIPGGAAILATGCEL